MEDKRNEISTSRANKKKRRQHFVPGQGCFIHLGGCELKARNFGNMEWKGIAHSVH
jgi:hypothetical protein